jgi:hypothetical protein
MVTVAGTPMHAASLGVSVTRRPPAGAAMSAPPLSSSTSMLAERPCAKLTDVCTTLRLAVVETCDDAVP